MTKTVLLAATAVLGGLMASSIAFADTTPDPDHLQTNAHVQITVPDENKVTPDIPGTDPSKPDHPTDNPGNTSTAKLKLVYASNFDFGPHELSSSTETWNVDKVDTQQSQKKSPYVEVSDRRGESTPWNVTVTQDTPFTNTKTGDIIKGAELTVGTPSFLDGTWTKTGDVTGNGGLLSTNPTTVMSTTGTHHFGEYEAMFEGPNTTDKNTDGVTLKVLGNSALAGDYVSNLTWTLNDTPK